MSLQAEFLFLYKKKFLNSRIVETHTKNTC